MFDKKLYKDTFSKLKASEDRLTEVMKMKPTQKKRRLTKTLLIAAVLAVLLTTTAFAYGTGFIHQVFFGKSQATQVADAPDEMAIYNYEGDTLDKEKAADKSCRAKAVDNLGDNVNFYRLEDAQAVAPMEIKVPQWMPDFPGIMAPGGGMRTLDDGTYLRSVWVSYCINTNYPYIDEDGTEHIITRDDIILYQHYVGPDAYIDWTTSFKVEDMVMVGDTEALYTSYLTAKPYGLKYQQLQWIKDGVWYKLDVGFMVDYDSLIKMAESIE